MNPKPFFKQNLHIVIGVVALAAILSYQAAATTAFAVAPNQIPVYNNWTTVLDCNYLVFTDGTTTFAKNCDTGAITYSGTNTSDVLEQAASQQGLIFVKAATYTINKQTDIPSFTTIQGEGIGKTIFQVGNSANILPFKNSNAASGNTNIAFKDFTIDLNGANQSNYGWIALSGTSNSEISGIEIKNPRTFGILWQAIGDPVTGIQSKNNRITDNVISGGVMSNDRLVINIQDSIVSQNTFTASPIGSNFDLSGGRSTKRVIIESNIFSNSGQMGIGLEDPQAVQITGNSFYNLANNCIQITHITAGVPSSDVIIADNYLAKCGTNLGAGMRLIDTSNLKVANNYINSTTTSCILVNKSTFATVSGIQVIGNQLSYCGLYGNSADGINLSGIRNGDISGNVVSITRRDGIIAHDIQNTNISGNVVFDGNKGGAADPRGVAIGTSGGSPSGVMIQDNSISYSPGNGGTMNRAIYTGNGDLNMVTNNRINGTYLASPAMSVAGAGSKVFRNQGFVTENIGTGTIVNGSKTATITHGLNYTPNSADISITWTNNPTNDTGNYWISGITSTQFVVNVRNDPGATGASFSWQVVKT